MPCDHASQCHSRPHLPIAPTHTPSPHQPTAQTLHCNLLSTHNHKHRTKHPYPVHTCMVNHDFEFIFVHAPANQFGCLMSQSTSVGTQTFGDVLFTRAVHEESMPDALFFFVLPGFSPVASTRGRFFVGPFLGIEHLKNGIRLYSHGSRYGRCYSNLMTEDEESSDRQPKITEYTYIRLGVSEQYTAH